MSIINTNKFKINSSLRVPLIVLSFYALAFAFLPTTAHAANWGDNLATKIDEIYRQLQPVVLSIGTLSLAFGAIQWGTSGGNVDKKSMGKQILLTTAISIAIYFSAGSFVNWAKDNLVINF